MAIQSLFDLPNQHMFVCTTADTIANAVMHEKHKFHCRPSEHCNVTILKKYCGGKLIANASFRLPTSLLLFFFSLRHFGHLSHSCI